MTPCKCERGIDVCVYGTATALYHLSDVSRQELPKARLMHWIAVGVRCIAHSLSCSSKGVRVMSWPSTMAIAATSFSLSISSCEGPQILCVCTHHTHTHTLVSSCRWQWCTHTPEGSAGVVACHDRSSKHDILDSDRAMQQAMQPPCSSVVCNHSGPPCLPSLYRTVGAPTT